MQKVKRAINLSQTLAKELSANSLYIFLYIIFSKFLKLKKKFIFTYRNKKFDYFVTNNMDLIVLAEIFIKKEYDFDYKINPEIILDLGANVGDTTIFYSLLFPNAKIYAVEPNPQVQEKLEKNTRQFLNVKICKLAIGDKTGKINLNLSDTHFGASLKTRTKNTKNVLVDVYSLIDFCKNEKITKIDILKFDIEGAEEYLLKPELLVSNQEVKITQIVGEIHDDLVSKLLQPMIESLNLQNFSKKVLSKYRYIIFGEIIKKI